MLLCGETRQEKKTLNIASPLAWLTRLERKKKKNKRMCIVLPIIEIHATFVEFKSNVFPVIIARKKRNFANVNFIMNKTRPG